MERPEGPKLKSKEKGRVRRLPFRSGDDPVHLTGVDSTGHPRSMRSDGRVWRACLDLTRVGPFRLATKKTDPIRFPPDPTPPLLTLRPPLVLRGSPPSVLSSVYPPKPPRSPSSTFRHTPSTYILRYVYLWIIKNSVVVVTTKTLYGRRQRVRGPNRVSGREGLRGSLDDNGVLAGGRSSGQVPLGSTRET